MHVTLPTTPGAILGYRKNGAPIRLQAGGSEAPPEPPASPAPPAADPQPPAPQPPAGQQPPAPSQDSGGAPPNGGTEPPAQPPAEAGSVEELPPWAQKLIRDTRNEAASNRTKAKEHADQLAALQTKSQAQLDAIAKALGLKPEEATPEQIMAERDAERARAEQQTAVARANAVELAVFRAAMTTGADGNALLDSRAFVASLAGLDPATDDFGEQVKAKITDALEAHPAWKLPATPNGHTAPPAPPVEPQPPAPPTVPASSPSSGFTGGNNGPRQWTQEDADRASPSELQAAMDKGLLVNLGFGPRRRDRRAPAQPA